MIDRLMDIKEVSKRTGLSLRTLDRLEQRKEGPPRLQIGPSFRRVAYRESDVVAWMSNLRRTADQRAA